MVRRKSNPMQERRFLAILSTLLGCQGVDAFETLLPAALNFGVTPVEVKKTLYQATAYLGIGRVFPFLKVTNPVLTQRGVKLPLEGQATTATEDRREAGTQAQVDIFGEGRDFWRAGREESRHINLWLADNCFGDYYPYRRIRLYTVNAKYESPQAPSHQESRPATHTHTQYD